MVAVITKDGVYIAAAGPKFSSRLLAASVTPKLASVVPDGSIVLAYAGVGPDFRKLLLTAQEIALSHELRFGERISVRQLAGELGIVMQDATLSKARPYGVELILAGREAGDCELYQLDAAGGLSSWKAVAIGEKASEHKSKLAAEYTTALSEEQARRLCNKLLPIEEDVLDTRTSIFVSKTAAKDR